MQEEPAMVEELMWVRRPAGRDLSRSQKDPGSFTSAFRTPGSRKLGEATLRPPAEHEKVISTDAPQPDVWTTVRYAADPRSREREEFDKLFVKAVSVLARDLIERATPVVSRWFTDQVIPSAKARWKKAVKARKGGRRTAVAAPETSVQPPPVDVVYEVGAVIDPQRPVMGRGEALQRLRLARAAELVRDEQLRIVRESWVVDDEDLPELDDAAVTIAQEQLGAGVQLTLESTPSQAEDVRVIQLSDILDTNPGPRDATPVRPA